MTNKLWILGEALLDCIVQSDGQLRPYLGGSPYNLCRAAALQARDAGLDVAYMNPMSTDHFGKDLAQQLLADGAEILSSASPSPSSLAVVHLMQGQPSYSFYREAVADRDYSAVEMEALLKQASPGVLHTGSLALVPPENEKVQAVVRTAKSLGWTISLDINLRPALSQDLTAYRKAVESIIPLADWLKCSDEDLHNLDWLQVPLGQARGYQKEEAHCIERLLKKGIKKVVLTMGAAGSVLATPSGTIVQPAYAVQLKDSVGAGDTFWASCLVGWMRDNADDSQCLKRAAAAAAINCTREACQPPTAAEIDQFLKTVGENCKV